MYAPQGLLGTGTPTLPAIAQRSDTAGGKPVLSCNLVLLWHALELMLGHRAEPKPQRLLQLLDRRHWRDSLLARSIGASSRA